MKIQNLNKSRKTNRKIKKISSIRIIIMFLFFVLVFLMLFKNNKGIKNALNFIKRGFKSEQVVTGKELQIGDIVYYNHKTAENSSNSSKQSVTINKGTTKDPGYGIKYESLYKWKKYFAIYKYEYSSEGIEHQGHPGVGFHSMERIPGYPINGKGYANYTMSRDNGVILTEPRQIKAGDIFYMDYGDRIVKCKFNKFNMGSDNTGREWIESVDFSFLTWTRIYKRVIDVKRGNFIEEVTSTNENEYPKNGIYLNEHSGSGYNTGTQNLEKYWYEYSGADRKELSKNQSFDASDYNLTWSVWDKKSDGTVMLVPNNPIGNFETGGSVGYTWWEHNAHKISSIFGYGEGADTSATQGFQYKVGSGIENAPDMKGNDKGNWKIGSNGVNVSGSRSLTLKEAEAKLGIDDTKIANGSYSIKNNKNQNYGTPYYGNTVNTKNVLCCSKKYRK